MSNFSGPYDRILGGNGGSVVVGTTGLITLTSPNLGTITTEQSSLTQAAQTLTITGGYTNQRFALFNQPTVTAASGLTVANAATVAIINAPTPAASALVTRPISLWVQNGQVGIDSNSGLSTATTAQVGPALNLIGTWITGGSATTTKPHVLVEPSGATSTGWSTAGTGLGVNAASGFTGNVLDVQLAGVSSFKVASASIATTVPLTVASSSSVNVNLLTLTQSVATSGTRQLLSATAGAHTGQAIVEESDVNWNLARTVTFTSGGGTIAAQRAYLVQAPTYAATTNTVTLTDAATVAISGAPASTGGNITFTKGPWSLWIQGGAVAIDAKVGRYNSVATLGWGQPAIYGYTRPAQQTNSTVTIASYTVGAADGSFQVSANVNVTTSTTVTMTVTCTYTDETSVSRTLTLPFILLAGTVVAAITTAQGNVPYEGLPVHIRAKASTSITVATAGTVTNVVYTAEGQITQIA